MRASLLVLLLASPAFAEWPMWDATCSAGHPSATALVEEFRHRYLDVRSGEPSPQRVDEVKHA